MPQIATLLVPVELDDHAVPVVQWAVLIARATGSRLTLLHVNEALESSKTRPTFTAHESAAPAPPMTNLRDAYNQAAQQDLTYLAEHYCTGMSVETVLLEGRAHATILQRLEETPSDLVVMGTHGKPWYQRLLLGSTAETVLRASPVPVLIVQNTVTTPPPPRLHTLLLPTDFSTASRAGEEWALYFAARGAQQIDVVHIIENPLLDVYDPDHAEFDVRQIMAESRQHPPRSAQPFWAHAHRVAQEKLDLLREQFSRGQAQVAAFVREGSAAEAILQEAESRGTDLIVMATHGHTGVRRLLIGSVAHKVIRTAPCPVLVVPSQE